MIFEFEPWKLDVDLDQTTKLYEVKDYSLNKDNNIKFINSLTPKQKAFFDNLGIDLMKVEVDYKVYDIDEKDNAKVTKIEKTTINFMLKGKILTLPDYQMSIYSDEDVFGSEALKDVAVYSLDEEDYIKVFDIDSNMNVVFKHPIFHFNDEIYKKWDCGYILGSILIMK